MKSKSTVSKIVRNLISSGPDEITDLELLRKLIILNIVLFFACIMVLFHGTMAILSGDFLLVGANYTTLTVGILLFVWLRKTRRPELLVMFMALFAGGYFLFLIGYGGGSKAVFLWALVYPIYSIIIVGIKKGTVVSGGLLVGTIILFLLGSQISGFTYYPLSLIVRFISVYLTIYIFTISMEWTRIRFYDFIKKSNNSLLENEKILRIIDVQKTTLIKKLHLSLDEVTLLQGLLPICSDCKKIRNDEGYWDHLEVYISKNSETVFSHGICPDCAIKLYPDYFQETDSLEDE
jgi:hypothetical protein